MELFKVTNDRFEQIIPLTKFDERTGEFEGWATVEEIDKSGEIIDLDKSWPYFQGWSDKFGKATDGASFGNIREQHDAKKAAGKLTSPMEIRTHPGGARGIYAKGIAVDAGTREKLAKRVLTGLSIGGKYVEKSEAGRYVADPSEISLVDNPCVENAMITVVKADGAEEIAKAVGFQPSQVWKCRFGHDHEKKDDARGCEEAPAEPFEKITTAQRNALADSDFALPGRRYPIDTEARARNALARVAQNGTPEEQATVKRKVKAKYPGIDSGESKKADEVSPLQKCMMCVQALSQVISGAQMVASCQDMEASDDSDTSEQEIAAEIRTAVTDLFDALRAIIDDVESDAAPGNGEMAMALVASMTKAATETRTAIKSLRVPKATGANSEVKEAHVEEPKKDEAKKADEAAKPETVAKAEGDALAKALEPIKAQLEKFDDAIATLAAVIARFGKLPAAPKGQLRAVAKEDDVADKPVKKVNENDPFELMKSALVNPQPVIR